MTAEALRERAAHLRSVAKELEKDAKRIEAEEAKAAEEEPALPKGVSIATAAEQLESSPETIRRWVKQGKLRGFQLPGGHWRVRADSLQALVESTEPSPGVIDPHASRSRLVAVEGSLRERNAA